MGIFWKLLLTNSSRSLKVRGWVYRATEGLTTTPKILLWQSLVKAKISTFRKYSLKKTIPLLARNGVSFFSTPIRHPLGQRFMEQG
jgi:hypothetical protein